MGHEADSLAHVCTAEDDTSRCGNQGREVLDGDGGILRAFGQRRGRHLKASGRRERDVGGQVFSRDGEGLRGARPVDGEFVGRGLQRCKQRSVCPRGIVVEVLDVCPDVLETHLWCRHTLYTSEPDVVDTEGTDTCAPGGTSKIEPYAYLPGIGLRLEVGGVGLIAVAGDIERDLVVVVLEILYAYASQDVSVGAYASLCECRESVCLVGGDIHNLRNLAVGPSAFPHIAVHREHVVVLIDLITALLAVNVLVRIVLVVWIYVPSFNVFGDILAG